MKKQGKNFMIGKTILLAVVVLLLCVNLFRWNAESSAGRRMPMPLGVGCSVILSDSMAPTLRVDDLVFVRKTDKVQVGDIIVFQDGQMLVIHRVVAVSGDRLQTKGDANNAPDTPIERSAVRGKLMFAIPGAGAVIRALRQPWVIAGLVGAALLLTVLDGRKASAGQKSKETEKQNTQEVSR